MSFFDRIKLWFAAHPLAPMFAGVVLILGIGFAWVIKNEVSGSYEDYTGTICCLSDSYYVESERSNPLRMMFVDLDNGRRVEVPVMYREFFVPYSPKARVLVRRVRDKNGPHPRFIAVRYLNATNS